MHIFIVHINHVSNAYTCYSHLTLLTNVNTAICRTANPTCTKSVCFNIFVQNSPLHILFKAACLVLFHTEKQINIKQIRLACTYMAA